MLQQNCDPQELNVEFTFQSPDRDPQTRREGPSDASQPAPILPLAHLFMQDSEVAAVMPPEVCPCDRGFYSN